MNKSNQKIQLLKNKINELNKYKKADIEIKFFNGSKNTNKSLLNYEIFIINKLINDLNEQIYSGLSSSNEILIPTISL